MPSSAPQAGTGQLVLTFPRAGSGGAADANPQPVQAAAASARAGPYWVTAVILLPRIALYPPLPFCLAYYQQIRHAEQILLVGTTPLS